MRICRVVAKMIDRNVTLNDAIKSDLGYSRMEALILQGVQSETAMRCHIEWLVVHKLLVAQLYP